MKNFYRIDESSFEGQPDGGNYKHYYFANKKLALRFLSREIIKRNKNQEDGLPDRDFYEDFMERKINRLVKNKKWEKVAPYFALYLYKESLETK